MPQPQLRWRARRIPSYTHRYEEVVVLSNLVAAGGDRLTEADMRS